MIQTVHKSGAPKPGREFEYALACKHRSVGAWLMLHTPRRQWRKARRRYEMWARACDRFHANGQDVVRVLYR